MVQDRKKKRETSEAPEVAVKAETPPPQGGASASPSATKPAHKAYTQPPPDGAPASSSASKPAHKAYTQPLAAAPMSVSRPNVTTLPQQAVTPVPAPVATPSVLDESAPMRRVARRRPAGPVRGQIAANDDGPSLGGLLHSLEQKPSAAPFRYAMIAGAVWGVLGVAFAWMTLASELSQEGATFAAVMARPSTFLVFAAIVVPIAVMWFLALLAWRAEELRLRSSTMTEVAVRLAEPDRMAEQSVASLGQAVRRQVSFMNDAVSRALGRAGELEALVHNQVAELEHSYEENERRIRGLINELAGERSELLGTSEKVTMSLRTLGNEVPALIDKLSTQQVKLAEIISGANTNLSGLESAITESVARLETTLGTKTEHLQEVLSTYSDGIGGALGMRTEQMQTMLNDYTSGLATALGTRAEQIQSMLTAQAQGIATALDTRTETLKVVFDEYARALDTTLASRAQALDVQVVDRTRSLDAAFSERLRLLDDSIMRSTMAIDSAVGEKARALTTALDRHAKTFTETVGRQAEELDDALMNGINAVRRSSESITRQSLKAIEGLAGQSDLLKNVSDNLLSQISGVTNRFDNQGNAILQAATALESANYKIDATLQDRHKDLQLTLDKLSGKADEFGQFVTGYSSSIEGSLSDAHLRARAVAEEIRTETQNRQREAIADLERMKAATDAEGERALDDMRKRFSKVTNEVTSQLGDLGSRFDETSEEVRQRAARASQNLAEQETRLREQAERLPAASRENTEAMRRVLQDQLKALDQLTQLAGRNAASRDVMPPLPGGSLTTAYASEAVEGPGSRALGAAPPSLPGSRPPADGRGENWSFGDLLARASRDEEG